MWESPKVLGYRVGASPTVVVSRCGLLKEELPFERLAPRAVTWVDTHHLHIEGMDGLLKAVPYTSSGCHFVLLSLLIPRHYFFPSIPQSQGNPGTGEDPAGHWHAPCIYSTGCGKSRALCGFRRPQA